MRRVLSDLQLVFLKAVGTITTSTSWLHRRRETLERCHQIRQEIECPCVRRALKKEHLFLIWNVLSAVNRETPTISG